MPGGQQVARRSMDVCPRAPRTVLMTSTPGAEPVSILAILTGRLPLATMPIRLRVRDAVLTVPVLADVAYDVPVPQMPDPIGKLPNHLHRRRGHDLHHSLCQNMASHPRDEGKEADLASLRRLI